MALSGEYVPSPSSWAREQVELYERTGGKEGGTMQGLPIVILTSVGARTGAIRKSPVMRVEHDGRYAVVASLGGAPRNPQWYHNVVTHPRVELQDGEEKHEYVAREVHGAEREEWWQRAVEAYPEYAEYATRTERVIPVLVLERA